MANLPSDLSPDLVLDGVDAEVVQSSQFTVRGSRFAVHSSRFMVRETPHLKRINELHMTCTSHYGLVEPASGSGELRTVNCER